MSDIKVSNSSILHKETSRDLIVQDESGETESVRAVSPLVKAGDQGITLEIDGRRIFVREPYNG